MTMINDKPFCFGMTTAFCVNSETCRDCESIRDCMTKVYTELRQASGIDSKLLTKILKNHVRLMKAADIAPPDDYETAKPQPTPDEILDSFLAELDAKKILRKGFIADDLSNAPDFFREVVEIIKLRGTTTQLKLVNHVKSVLPGLKDPISHIALAVQALLKTGIIVAPRAKKQIKWVGNAII